MADPLTSTLRLTQPTVGGDSGAWGGLLNSDLSYIDQAVNGILTINVGGGPTFSLEALGDSGDQARYLWYKFSGISQNCVITIPANQKVGIASNTSGVFAIQLTTGSGATVTMQPNQTFGFYCDGTNVAVLPWGTPGIVGAIGISGTTTLTVAESGAFVEIQSGSSSYTVTVPTPVGNSGTEYLIQIPSNLTGTVTFSTPAGSFVGGLGSGSGAVGFTGVSGAFSFIMISDGANWNNLWCSCGLFQTVQTTGNAVIGGILSAAGNEALTYVNGTGQSVPSNANTTLTNWTKVSDRLNANFNATSGVYTVPATGIYHISFQSVGQTSAGYTSGDTWNNLIVPNTGQALESVGPVQNGGILTTPGTVISGIFALTAGQTVTFKAFQNHATTIFMNTNAALCYLSIVQLP